MSSELLYTSAPQGLRHGSRGFCTVLTTAGMPINLISKLEAISGYRHLSQPGAANANPTAYAHQVLMVAGQRRSIISRIADYGNDYSGRSNKLAHHVIVDPNERPAAGPAWLLKQRSVMRTEWLGHCETPGTGPRIPSADQTARICTTWRNVTGDAGWGGVIAEAIASGDSDPMWIIFPVSQHGMLLDLIDESIALLPPASRWSATFNTFAANIPPDVQCKIRFVPAGSEEARFAADAKSSIDLTKKPSITSASHWVERARGTQRPSAIPDAGGRDGSFNAVQEEGEALETASAWEVEEEVVTPPPPPGPPELPPEVLHPPNRTPWYVGGGLAAALVLLSLTWVVARTMAGLPLVPGGEQAVIPQTTVVANEPIPEEPAPFIAPVPTEDLIFNVYLDQKQLMAWALAMTDEEAETDFPNPIELRGGVRLAAIREQTDTTTDNAAKQSATTFSPEAAASLYSWGGVATSFAEPAEVTILTTRLSGGRQTIQAVQLPETPKALGGNVYWNRDTGDLIAFLNRQWTTETENPLADAYESFANGLVRVTTLMFSIKENQSELPADYRNLAEPLLAKTLRGEQSMMRSLMRSPNAALALSELANTLSTALQDRVESSASALSKAQQVRLVRIVAQCGDLARESSKLRESFLQLQQGQSIEVPDLQFHDSRGRVLRQVPLRFTLSL